MISEIFIVSHGFFDFLHFNYLLENTVQYLFIMCLFMFVYYVFQPLSVFSFLIMSKYHFDNDINNIVEIARYVDYELYLNKLSNVAFKQKIGSVLFLSTMCSHYNFKYWKEVLYSEIRNNIFVYPIIFFFAIFLIFDLFRIKKDNQVNKIVIACVFITGICLGPYYQMLYYMAFIHTPVSLCFTAKLICSDHCFFVKYSLMIFYVILVNILIYCLWSFVLKDYVYLIDGYIPSFVISLLQTHILLHNTRCFD